MRRMMEQTVKSRSTMLMSHEEVFEQDEPLSEDGDGKSPAGNGVEGGGGAEEEEWRGETDGVRVWRRMQLQTRIWDP